MTVNEQKKLLRKVMLQKRKELSDSETAVKNSAITEKLLSLEKVQSAELILSFVSARGEVGTREFISKCLEAGKTVAVPRCIDGSNMEFCVIHTFDDLEKGMYGIDEPKQHCEIIKAENAQNSVLIVPALCFNSDGYRLGYGKGYYDRFISRYKGYTVGVCYSEFMTDDIPVDEYDRCVDIVITEKQKGNENGE
ncbi:MAG: 5-formyltetrahydrofolate cyclo-ligase [Ruminiclostridium sp.]|nr:5-formyltetrahydrofolate cyclo-ligase [Ruminiclostridium sp.]